MPARSRNVNPRIERRGSSGSSGTWWNDTSQTASLSPVCRLLVVLKLRSSYTRGQWKSCFMVHEFAPATCRSPEARIGNVESAKGRTKFKKRVPCCDTNRRLPAVREQDKAVYHSAKVAEPLTNTEHGLPSSRAVVMPSRRRKPPYTSATQPAPPRSRRDG